jgi:quinoprotein glucose dehydrogenase
MASWRGPLTWSDWALIAFGAILLLIGLPIFAGGAWLAWLGGSLYYLLAGVGLLASGGLLVMQRPEGASLYGGVFVATVAWAFWEVGGVGWSLVPRVVGPAVLAVVLLCFLPVLRRWGGLQGRPVPSLTPATAFAALTLIGLAPLAVALVVPGATPLGAVPAQQPPTIAQAGPPVPQATAQAETPTAGADSPQERGALDHDTAENWLAYGGNNHATRFTPADQITPQNVSQLEVAWHTHTGDLPPDDDPTLPPAIGAIRYAFQNTPLKVGDRLYVCTPSQIVIALDPATGREQWRFDPQVDRAAMANVTTSTCRGVAFYEVPEPVAECQTRIVYGTLDSRLLAIDAQTGAACRSFGSNGSIDLNAGIGKTLPGYVSMTSPPTIVRGVAVVGHQVIDGQYRDAPSGVVRGYDAVTGAFRWAWDMGRPGVTTEPGPNETYTRGTPNMWTIASGDDELGLVYLPTGNSAGDYYGGDRQPYEEQFSSSIVAVDVTTGLVRWSFQTVHHDIWDYDLGSQGTLVDFPTANGPVPALILPTKQGQIFVFDRRNGQLLAPIEERPVPQGAVKGDWTAPTQPFSTGMPDLIGDLLTERDMWGVSPLDQLWCRIQFHRMRYQGPYTPPAVGRPTVFSPGFNGGVDWGGVAVDAERHLLVVNNNNLPNLVQLLTQEEVQERGIRAIGDPGPRTTGGQYAQRGLPYGAYSIPWRTAIDVPCSAPPWGYLGAIDLRTRQFVWRIPLGTGRDHGPFGVPSMLPIRMGVPNNGGALVTRGGLIFISATLDRVLRAFDTRSGAELWHARLPAGGQAGPLSYVHNGRQYVVIAAGGHNSMETRIGDSVIAYALPMR